MDGKSAPKQNPGKGRRVVSRDGPNPVDIHIGGRIRLRRMLMGLSQSELGQVLGLSFQQVQKYERGANRVSASTLFRLASRLDVPIAFFFDGLPDGPKPVASALHEDDCIQRESLEMLRNYRILPPHLRRQLSALLSTMSRDHGHNGE